MTLQHWDSLSAIRQKGESQNGCFKKTNHAKFSEKRIFLTPWHTHVRNIWTIIHTEKTVEFFFFFLEVTITLAMKISVAMNCKKYLIFLLYWWLWTNFCLPEIVCIYYLFLLIRRKTLENEDNISSTSLKIKVSFCFSL